MQLGHLLTGHTHDALSAITLYADTLVLALQWTHAAFLACSARCAHSLLYATLVQGIT
jgi:hypothetical protein